MSKIIPRDLIKHLEWVPGSQLPPPRAPPSPPGSGAQVLSNPIVSLGDYWSIDNVVYKGELYIADLSKSLLDGGNAHKQDEWASFSRESKERGEFYMGNMPLNHAVFRAAYLTKDNPECKQDTEDIRAFLKQQFRSKYPLTLTRVIYSSSGNDRIIHDYGLPDADTIDCSMMGPDEWVKDSPTPDIYQHLVGSSDINEIHAIYNWINDTNVRLYRVNSKPSNTDERVARFGADSGRAGLYCYGDPSVTNSGLGVRLRKKILGGSS